MGDTSHTYVAGFPSETLPYYQEMLGQVDALVAADKYKRYEGERFAQFTPAQKEYFERVMGLGLDPRSLKAARMTKDVYSKLYGAKYKPGKFNFGAVNPLKLTNYQMAGGAKFGYKPEDWSDKAAQAKAAEARYKEKLKEYKIGRVKDVKGGKNLAKNAAQMEAARSKFKGDIKTKSFARPGTADRFMSPYMQSVVDIQQREAQRQADIAAQQRGAEAVQAGAFGGSRQAIMEAEAARNLAQQKGDIQAKGLQDAYAQAQAQFNQEQQAGLTAQQANLGANLQVAMGNLNNKQQAAVQNQAAVLQMQGMSAQQALQAALANQQTEMQRRQLNQRAGLDVQQLRSQNRMQIQMQNLANRQQTELANVARQFEAQKMPREQALQRAALLLDDKFRRQNANLNANLSVQQLRSGQDLTAQQFNRNLAMEAARMGEESRRFGADYGYRNTMGAGQAAQIMGGLGRDMYGQNIGNLQLMGSVGNQQQAGMQRLHDYEYEQFLAKNRFPYEQLGFKAAIFRGLPNPQQNIYNPPPSAFNSGFGFLSAYGGMQQQPGFSVNIGGGGGGNAKGGVIPPAGLMDLAMSRAYA